VIRAVVFDLDGVLLDSEGVWDDARRKVAAAAGGRWTGEATGEMQGMSSPEWSAYMRESLHVDLDPPEIARRVVAEVLGRYAHDGPPLLPGAFDAVRRIGSRWPLALASSANREVIEAVLDHTGHRGIFRVTVSSEEVPRGKPSPDVYREACRRLGYPPEDCVAVEDSANGILSALAAGLHVAAVPNRQLRPPADVLARATGVFEHLRDLTVGALVQLGEPAEAPASGAGGGNGRLDEEELESFPASDPHQDWAGPPD
jgi:HAD superfamily hydrolase (TIGR01509 family)